MITEYYGLPALRLCLWWLTGQAAAVALALARLRTDGIHPDGVSVSIALLLAMVVMIGLKLALSSLQRIDHRMTVHGRAAVPWSIAAIFLSAWPSWITATAGAAAAVGALFYTMRAWLRVWQRLREKRGAISHLRSKLVSLGAEHGPEAIKRLQRWLALESGDTPSNPGLITRPPSFPGLPSQIWYRNDQIPWLADLEKQSQIIRDEALTLYQTRPNELAAYNYVGVADADWRSLILYRDGFIEENCRLCPQTAHVLRSLPVRFASEVILSVLKPHSRIAAHRDTGNLTLTAHLGLAVPTDCGMSVGGESVMWREGQCLVFDPSYEHAVWNDSDEVRIILLFDVFHPDLTDIERCFLEANDWHAA